MCKAKNAKNGSAEKSLTKSHVHSVLKITCLLNRYSCDYSPPEKPPEAKYPQTLYMNINQIGQFLSYRALGCQANWDKGNLSVFVMNNASSGNTCSRPQCEVITTT